MSAAELIAAVLWLALTAYAVLAGADFGGGVWDLFATGPRAEDQRRAVADATTLVATAPGSSRGRTSNR